MHATTGFAVFGPKQELVPYSFHRRALNSNDILIEITHCGVCHSDIHQARGEWGESIYPMVPGHEIVGYVKSFGSAVKGFKIGDPVGVGCMVDSCGACIPCKENDEQFCEKHVSYTYNSTEQDQKTPTMGGYSSEIVVKENFVLKLPLNLPLDRAAPLLCAGITTYSPLKYNKVGPNTRVAIAGLGGLGHMGVKFALAFGAEVSVLSTSKDKKEDAHKLGAKNFIDVKNKEQMKSYEKYFDIVLDTISSSHPIDDYLNLLNRNGKMVMVGIPSEKIQLQAASLVFARRSLSGSLIGGVVETQEMLDFCGKHEITSDIELISIFEVNHAYERMLKGDVKYRFVIDMKSAQNRA